MHLRLIRRWATVDGIYGELEILNKDTIEFQCFTVELPWRDNTRRVSCIPQDVYTCQRAMYNAGGYETFEVMNVPDRSEIKIHIANVPSDLAGCVGLGKSFGWVKRQYAVLRSGETFREFMKAMEGIDTITLIILEEKPNYG